MIINGSPRAPKSNSRQYAELFLKSCSIETGYFVITQTNHLELCRQMDDYSDVLFVFPLYVDAIPVTLLNFLKTLEKYAPRSKPTISILINCGFIEPEQNDVAVKIMKLYSKQTGYPCGSVLKIGSGEAILTTPFRRAVRSKIEKLASSIIEKNYLNLQVSMPLPKWMFLRASKTYWENYGRKNGVTKEQMATLEIEG